MSNVVTEGIRIQTKTTFMPEHCTPGRWVFSYHITITNESETTAQLLSRHWIITDDWGEVEEVKGSGVVGEQPKLSPGDSFEYSSYCPLTTPVGQMEGTYQMVRDDGSSFDAKVGPFFFRDPNLS